MFGIGSDRRKRSRGSLEQESIDRRLVLIGDCADFGGQREYDVEIGRRQQVRLSRRQPSLRRPPQALRAMAFAGLHNAQDLSLPAKDVINLSVFGGLMAVMTLTSGIGLALK